MVRKFFNFILVVIFVGLVFLFVYKQLSTNEMVQAPVAPQPQAEVASDQHTTAAVNGAGLSKEELDKAIYDYLMNNPETIIKSLENIHQKRRKDVGKKAAQYLQDNLTSIQTEGKPPILGNAQGDIKIVMFYDYNCSYCKKAHQNLQKLLASDPNVQIILRPIAILGENSLIATKSILATYHIAPDKLSQIHNELMQTQKLDQSKIDKIISKYKIDQVMLDNELSSYALQQLINHNIEFATNLNINGAPTFVINELFVPGFLHLEQLQQIIIQLRAKQGQQLRQNKQEPAPTSIEPEVTDQDSNVEEIEEQDRVENENQDEVNDETAAAEDTDTSSDQDSEH